MTSSNQPQITPLTKGQYMKVLKITARAGMIMPEHHTTQETVIVVRSGEGILKINNQDLVIKTGDSMIIPAMESHSLSITKDFNAVITMPINGKIQF